MAQLSVFDKQRHHSEKDMTVSIGKNEVIYITFRNDAWKLFTESEKIAVRVTARNTLTFGDPEKHDDGVVFKLGRNKSGFPETTEHTRYLQIKGKVRPGLLDAARSMLGSIDLVEARRMKAVKMRTVMSLGLTEEKKKEIKESLEKCCEEVKLDEQEDLQKFFTPSGFIELHGAASGERFIIRISDIQEVSEVLPGVRVRSSEFSPELHDAKTVVLARVGRWCLETYDEVINKINEGITPRMTMNSNGVVLYGSEV